VLLRALASSLLVVAALAQPPAISRRPDPAREVTETKHLTVTTSASTLSAAPGGSATLFVDVAPKARMHVYAPDQKAYIPVTLTLDTRGGFHATAPKFPPSEKLFFEPLQETQRVYSKPFRIVQPVTLSRDAPGASITVAGTVRYQACDDAICYMPQNVPVSWTIAVKR
jgi:DsbC/DsbD-like thiol-disulfide interchange protein